MRVPESRKIHAETGARMPLCRLSYSALETEKARNTATSHGEARASHGDGKPYDIKRVLGGGGSLGEPLSRLGVLETGNLQGILLERGGWKWRESARKPRFADIFG